MVAGGGDDLEKEKERLAMRRGGSGYLCAWLVWIDITKVKLRLAFTYHRVNYTEGSRPR